LSESPPPPPRASQDDKPAEHRFPCDRCGADLRFDPPSGNLVCDFCGNTSDIGHTDGARIALRELDFRSALARSLPEAETEQTRAVTCTNCGAVFEFDPNVHAAECPFCATPIVTDTGAQRRIRPRGVLPFALSEKDAHKAMADWLGRLWFAPGGLKKYARKGRRLQGMYVPYWTFDADTRSSYRGERGTVYYVTRTVRQNGRDVQRREQRIRWHAVSGRVARWFDDVLVLASTSLPKRHTDALEPWDLAELEPYRPEFLAGFRAESYTVELEQGYEQAREKMDRVIRRDVRFDIGGDRQRIHEIRTRVGDVTFKHILLPVWLAAYRYRGKSYRFVVNGRTGRVQGQRPWSAWKIAFAVIALALVAGALGYVLARQQG